MSTPMPWRSDGAAAAGSPGALRDYALIADGERGALLGPHGEFAWMCAPRWDSDAVFAGLLGGPGEYSVSPLQRCVPGGAYRPGSLIWTSQWTVDGGTVTCRDALALPSDPHTAVVLRRVGVQGLEVPVRVRLAPAAGFGEYGASELTRNDGGAWTARLGPLWLRWTGAEAARPVSPGRGQPGPVLELTLHPAPGEQHDLVLEISERPFTGPAPDPEQAWKATEDAWSAEVPPLDGVLARRDARQAYAVLRGLTSSAGGMAAAATTSLPEQVSPDSQGPDEDADSGSSYDYRYAWIRDQSWAALALCASGSPQPLLGRQLRFLIERVLQDGPRLAPAYTVYGGTLPPQRPLHLPGYPGSHDVLGNRAGSQFQLDAFGEVLLLLATAARQGLLDDSAAPEGSDGWAAARTALDAVRERWQEPDSGVWELGPRMWTQSRLACVSGLRALAGSGGPRGLCEEAAELADRLLDWAGRNAVHPSGCWQRAVDDPRTDAALLLPGVRGAVPPDDPRQQATVRAVARELTDDHFAYRFRPDDRPLGESEGAFLMCGFTMALAEAQQGRQVSAHRWFERNRAACGPSGLYAEEYDVAQRQLRGNLPQAFVHALLLECAAKLSG
ncbi:glycoside hydrolase family 15 protein [Phaeacidiphilus oryzae]|uniref:glycoside hydrolase family 15 protein n=1 Tax=Phaeacidiphilus oryzae TaxID=348818 RepID=UPI001F2AC7CD|nr:glycoside hydrolase family 15 protein [Phaeacidiphilus oryzae]